MTGYKGRRKAMEAKLCQLLKRGSKMGHIACIPASITIAIEEEKGRGREIELKRGGNLLIKNKIRTNFAYVFT